LFDTKQGKSQNHKSQNLNNRKQKTENRKQKTENRKQKTENRKQKTENRKNHTQSHRKQGQHSNRIQYNLAASCLWMWGEEILGFRLWPGSAETAVMLAATRQTTFTTSVDRRMM
jgi:(p)ppGpp synthase/HD superfamily hydrolase